MIISLIIFQLSFSLDINLALQDLSDDPLIVNGWNVVKKGIGQSYALTTQQCNQNFLKLSPYPNFYQKTFDIPHFEFDQITIEMDVYFINFSQSFLRIKVDQKIIFQQTFSTNNLQQNNVCGSVDGQYTIQQIFYSTNKQINVVIFYTTLSPDSYIGIRNLNIYTNGYKLSNGCTMELPYLQDGTCVQFCDNPNSYLGGEDMLVCYSDQIGLSQLIGIYETTQKDLWQFSDLNYANDLSQYLTENYNVINNDVYDNIMYSELFSSALTCYQQCYYITQNIEDSYLIQITLVLYIFGDWNDGSQLGIYFSGQALFQNNMVRIIKVKGEYYCTTESKFHFTNVSQTLGGISKARRTLITFQGKFYSSQVKIGFSQSIFGSGSYGFGNLYVYQSYEDPNIVLSGIYGIPFKCITDYYAYNGQCVQDCPPYSYLDRVNNKCTDLSQQQSVIFDPTYQQSNRLGYYIVKDFYDNNFNKQTINSIFQIIPPTYNNYQNAQPFSFIGSKKILGGFNSWGWGSYGILIDLPIHNQIRIYFKLYLIDDWQNGDTFKYVIDSNLMFTYLKNNPNQQLQGLNTYDQQINVQEVLTHTQQQLKITFNCQIQSKNASVASCGISDLFILYDQYVDIYCNQSNIYFSYFTNNCEICDGSDCFLYPTNYYLNNLSDKAFFGCQQRDQENTNQCQICSAPSYQIKYPEGICECVDKFIIQDYQCTHCHYSCDTCSGTSQNDCLTCNPSRQLIGQSCQCIPNYFDVYSVKHCSQIKDYQSQQCDYTCQTCFARRDFHCVTCPNNSFRTLNQNNCCECDEQYMDVGHPICQKIICDPSCLTCKGIFSSDCLTCQTNFRLDKGHCICDGQFNNLINSNICQQNHLNCNQIKCQGQQLHGYLDCNPDQYRYLNIINSSYQYCDCFDGYYDYLGSCELCDQTCLTCQTTATLCLTCDPIMSRQLNINSCECIQGYNDKLQSGQMCVLNYIGCHYSCTDCFGPNYNQCLSCTEQRILSDSICLCQPSKYENLITQQCDDCNPLCLTCNGNSISNCLSCDQSIFRTLSLNECICQQGYFDLLGVCQECHYSCYTCSSAGPNNCIACNILNLRLFDDNECTCYYGYSDIGFPLCEVCPDDCEECDSKLFCVSCKVLDHIINQQGRCDCRLGYKKNVDGQCVDCQSIQGRLIMQCEYKNSFDKVWTYGEKCDDGNILPRDGCTQFLIDKGFQCDNYLLQPSFCYQCPKNCQKCHHIGVIECEACIDNYFKHENLCYRCPDNCKVCNSYSQCIKCIDDILPIQGQCQLCEKGYEYKDRECKSICGDGILTQEEQCDDSNIFNNDGCNQQCQVEAGFICNPECKLEENVIKTKLLESGSKTNNILIQILYFKFNINLLNVKIEFFNLNEDYNFKVNMINENKFEIQFTLSKPIKSFNIIHIYLPIQQQQRLLDYQIREYTFTPVEADYYDTQQESQRQTTQKIQSQFYKSLAYVGPITLILGGTSFFLQILDILSWINNFYYININYPGNVQIFFEKANWGLIINIPQLYEFQSDSMIPQRFQDKGIDGLIINNVQQLVLIFLAIVISILTSSKLIKLIKWYQNRRKQLRSLLQSNFIQIQQQQSMKQQIPQVLQQPQQNNEQVQNNGLLQKILKQLQLFYENRYLIILQTFNTSILDIALSIIINLKYLNYFNDLCLLIGFLFCIIFTVLSLSFLYILYIIITGHKILKRRKIFISLYNQLFQGLKQDKISKLYGFQAIFQKTLFIIFVVILYEKPLLQTLFCSSILLGLIFISIYKYPFSTYKDILSQFIPDISLALILMLCCLLAADEQIYYFTYQQRYNIGWVILAIISLSIIIQLIFIIKEAYGSILTKIKWLKSIIRK